MVYRDPLERFLSAFIDKCITWRLKEGHCEPIKTFGTEGWNDIALANHHADPLDSVQYERRGLDDQQLFEAYIEAMPLKWNIHFWLQSTLCDHERVQWDFVGMLNATFHDQVLSLIRMNDGNPSFQAALTEIFFEREQVVEHATSSKVTKYFTGPNVKRLLRYYAQDYIRIGMPLPGWLGKIPFPEA